MTQNFSRYRIFSWILDDTLWLAVVVVLNLYDAWGEAISELFLVFAGDR
jgi:hypothetical protein